MSSVKSPLLCIRIDDDGQEWIEGTPYHVIDIVMDHLTHGWSPAEIQYQHYGKPSLAQIHAALAYYYDNQNAFDERIRRDSQEVRCLRQSAGETPLERRLKAEGKIA